MTAGQRLALSGALVGAIATTAFVTPAAYADTSSSSCTLDTTNTPGAPDPYLQSGILNGSASAPGGVSTTVTCEVRLNSDPFGNGGTLVATGTAAAPGSFVALSTPVTFHAPYAEPVWLCAADSWIDSGQQMHFVPKRCFAMNASWIRLPTGDYVHTLNGTASNGPS